MNSFNFINIFFIYILNCSWYTNNIYPALLMAQKLGHFWFYIFSISIIITNITFFHYHNQRRFEILIMHNLTALEFQMTSFKVFRQSQDYMKSVFVWLNIPRPPAQHCLQLSVFPMRDYNCAPNGHRDRNDRHMLVSNMHESMCCVCVETTREKEETSMKRAVITAYSLMN